MKESIIDENSLTEFRDYLQREERSGATIRKYTQDVGAFAIFCEGKPLTKEMVVAYKADLIRRGYAARSVNSMLASLNCYFAFVGHPELRVKHLKIQTQLFCPEDRELTKQEYARLCSAARAKRDQRLLLIMQTICATGIRVSELRFVTVEAVERGEAIVCCKGKNRSILLVKQLQKRLKQYIRTQKVVSGPVFVTASGRPVDRTNIWREMKGLCAAAGIEPKKVFPHNLRHLFARVFYALEKDIAKLADILGHSSINTTRIYIISTGTEHRQKMEQMRLVL